MERTRRRVRGLAVEVEAWRYADGSEAKAMALCYTTVWPKVRLSGVCQVVKVAITELLIVLVAPESQSQPSVARESWERKELATPAESKVVLAVVDEALAALEEEVGRAILKLALVGRAAR